MPAPTPTRGKGIEGNTAGYYWSREDRRG